MTASFTHLMRSSIEIKNTYTSKSIDSINFVYIRTLKYNNSSDKRRMINWLIFSWRVSRLFKFIGDKPDVVIVSSPSLVSFLGARSLANRFKSKLIFDVRDIWPLALVELGGFSIKNPFIRVMQWLEVMAYQHSDVVSSSLPCAIEHMEAHGMKRNKFLYLPNGFNKEELLNKDKLEDFFSSQIPKNKFVVGYVGSLGLANAMSILLKAAKLLNSDKSIVFVIVGKGNELKNLKSQVKSLNLINVVFIDSVPKKQVQSVIQLFDVCYIGWLEKSGYKFGISPQKLPEYLFSGKPIIHSYSGRGCVVKEANAGISVPAEDHVAIKNAIIQLQGMTSYDRGKLGENGKKYSMRHYDYKNIAKSLESVF